MTITEENFIAQVKQGNNDALDYIVKTYGWVIKTVVRKHLYNIPWYTEECMNDVLLAIWRNIEKFNPEAGTFKNWIAGVSRYTSLNYLRKYKKEIGEILYDESILDREQEELKTELEGAEAFSDLIKCLKPEDRELFTKLFKEDQSLDEISQESGVSKSVLYNRISRAKSKIKKKLEF